ncbi:MAG: TIGR03557 family F420-dependent LLM class oxidoreductase [Actinobacteria bacterium]|nr:TIGR03557 family F420-dependent LLM class oxidoreductase [Actinomycetota bacterium]
MIGYALICEEHPGSDLIRHAPAAQDHGFDYLSISDHFHPWTDTQGHSPFAWSILGALAVTTDLPLLTAVTCPIKRYHPALVAQMAATVAELAPDRLTLGLGSGELLNEHVVGGAWPDPVTRLEMVQEAIAIVRALFEGDEVSHRGRHFTVDRARLYTLPSSPPPIALAAGGESAARVAADVGAALVTTSPDADLIGAYRDAGGEGPVYGQITCCWADSEEAGRDTMRERWPQTVVGWDVSAELPTPSGFEDASAHASTEEAVGSSPVGPDPEPYADSVSTYLDAGCDHVAFHQVGPDQTGFLAFAKGELLPRLRS